MGSVLLNIPSKKLDLIQSLKNLGYIILRATLKTTTLHHIVIPKLNSDPKSGEVITFGNKTYITITQNGEYKDCQQCDVWKDGSLDLCDRVHCMSKERADKQHVYFKRKA